MLPIKHPSPPLLNFKSPRYAVTPRQIPEEKLI